MPGTWTRLLNQLQDKAMFALIGRSIIYNVSWEDPRIDCELLDLTDRDNILMLTSGGCNVLDMALEGAGQVVAADLNPRQNALLELKIVCIKHLTHEQFFQLFASNNQALFLELYPTRLRPHLSEFAKGFWDENGRSFFKNVMWAGASGFAAWLLVKMARLIGLGGLIDEAKGCSTLEEQRTVYAKYTGRVDAIAGFLNFTKRLWCPLIAVPASQLHLFGGNIVKLAAHNLFNSTFLRGDNYHYYGYLYGCYTRECCPRYLKAEHFDALKTAVDRIVIRTGTLQEVASAFPDGHFSRYILLDHMDWMPMRMVLDEWSVFVRKARPDVRFLWRSFSDVQHIAPLKYLNFHPANVRAALSMYPDRVFMYNSTHLATLNPAFTVVPRVDFRPSASLWDDATVLYHNIVAPVRGGSHKEKLESFYAGQARSYDVYRHRFLHGRLPMIEAMPTPVRGVWLDIGGGTAANLEHFKAPGAGLRDVFSKVIVLDLCRPLLEVARARVAANGWEGLVECVEGDACDPAVPGLPAAGSVDVITMSYSLTMIPNWRAALANAARMLKPGGHFAISDFTVTPEHSWVTRAFWPRFFALDNVMLSADHIATLREVFPQVHLHVDKGGFPYVPLAKAPFYFYVGQKPGAAPSTAASGALLSSPTASAGSGAGAGASSGAGAMPAPPASSRKPGRK